MLFDKTSSCNELSCFSNYLLFVGILVNMIDVIKLIIMTSIIYAVNRSKNFAFMLSLFLII